MNIPELEGRLLPRLRGMGERLAANRWQVHSHPVGRNNVLQGHAFYLDCTAAAAGRLRLYLIFTGLDGPEPSFHSGCGWEPRIRLLPGPGPVPDLDTVLRELEARFQKALRAGPGELDPGPKGPKLREAEPWPQDYEVLSAALSQRFSAWAPTRLWLDPVVFSSACGRGHGNWATLQRWYGDLRRESVEFRARDSWYGLDAERLEVPFSVVLQPSPRDWLDFYRAHPDAQGVAAVSSPGYSADGGQAALRVANDPGFSYLAEGWAGPEPARPDGPRIGSFQDLLVMERGGEGWKMAARLDPGIPEPLRYQREAERERLQAELGPRGRVRSVVVQDQRAVEAFVVVKDGTEVRVVLFDPFSVGFKEPFVSTGPVVLVVSQKLTGAAILEGLQNPLAG